MLSIPHMIVVFLVVLVVFGPQKLPELARSFGKLMAEFRKASNDFKNAFEEEMRDLERQARIAELKKQVAEANAAADAAMRGTPNPVLPQSTSASSSPGSPPTTPLAHAAANSYSGDFPEIKPPAEAVPRSDGANGQGEAQAPTQTELESPGTNSPDADSQTAREPKREAKVEPEAGTEHAAEKPSVT
jgi:sec-independent protein translocase protein TatB